MIVCKAVENSMLQWTPVLLMKKQEYSEKNKN